MKLIQEKETTTNSHVYVLAHKHYISNQTGKCSRCRPHHGCNHRYSYYRSMKTWKHYRNKQYKAH